MKCCFSYFGQTGWFGVSGLLNESCLGLGNVCSYVYRYLSTMPSNHILLQKVCLFHMSIRAVSVCKSFMQDWKQTQIACSLLEFFQTVLILNSTCVFCCTSLQCSHLSHAHASYPHDTIFYIHIFHFDPWPSNGAGKWHPGHGLAHQHCFIVWK